MRIGLFAVLVIFAISFSSASGLDAMYGLGTINDLAVDGESYYYFEVDMDLKSSTWIQDTKIKIHDGKNVRDVSEKLFIYPTEIVLNKDNIYFAALSESCAGQLLCDYQDVYKMSKKDGGFAVLAKSLRSAVHISLDHDSLYVSESTGKIWKIGQGGSRELAVQAGEIVMDVIAKDGSLYWIEEISDQNSRVLTLDGSKSKTIAKNLQIPYDLTIQNGKLYWSEIQVKAVNGNYAEVTAIKSYDGKESTLMEFHNASPVSVALNQANYGPYLVFGDYLFLVNNTNADSTIHMLNLHNSSRYDVGVTSGYDAKYLRTDGSNLVVVGVDSQGFVIDRHPLPVSAPEFPYIIFGVMSVSFAFAFILQRFWRS